MDLRTCARLAACGRRILLAMIITWSVQGTRPLEASVRIRRELDRSKPGKLMSTVGQKERKTQQRVVKLFRDKLGYDYLGDWTDRAGQQQHRGRPAHRLPDQERLHARRRSARRHLRAAHRGGQSQPQPLRQQQGRLQPAALRRAGEDRGRQGHRDRQADQLG